MATIPTQNAVPSESPRDLKFNAGKIDEFVNSLVNIYIDRFGTQHYTIEGLRWLALQAISQYGYITIDSFQAGANITLPNQILRDTTNGEYYRWDGTLPKSVPAGSTPQSTGGVGKGAWVSVGDGSLRASLAMEDGVDLVKNAVDKRGDTMQRLQITGDSTASATGNMVVGNLTITPGTDAARDAYTVARLIQNSPTNCHGFADKTTINTASDYGGYGVFDSTLTLLGGNTHNHVYSFQDRTNYSGSGLLENMQGLYSAPTHTGSGVIGDRKGVYINDVVTSSTGTVQQQSGIYIEHLKAATQANVAVNIRQMDGFSIYSPNGGRMYHNGVVGFGVQPTVSNFAINFRGDPTGTFYGFASTDVNAASFGVSGDNKIQFIGANEVRLQVKTAATFQRAVTPGNDNSTPLGDAVNRWSTVFAGTGAINTSDGREKTKPIAVEKLSQDMGHDENVILDAWGSVSVIAFRWLASVKDKGDGARWHFGVIAQQVKQAFEDRGIDGTRLGLLCYDKWDDQYDIVAEEVVDHPPEYSGLLGVDMQPIIKTEAWTEVVKPESTILVTPAGDRWGIRADQCLWLEAAYQRRERQRLEERLSKLERLAGGK